LDADLVLSIGLLITGIAGAALLVVAEFSTILEIPAQTVVIDRLKGGERHNYAFIPIAGFSLLLLFGAVRGKSRPAAIGVIILGGIALGIVLGVDAPDIGARGLTKKEGLYEVAGAEAGGGFRLELVGAALLVVAGLGALLFSRPAPKPAPRRRPRTPDAPPSPPDRGPR
jgi:hypothetical protein